MFGSMEGPEDGLHRHGRGRCRGKAFHAMGGEHSGGHRGRGGRRGRGFGDGDGGRFGRRLIRGDLRLVILALIGDESRHGYDLIKQIEEMSGGSYAPSPGVVYPTLTYLEEAGHVQAEEDGNKKSYSITEDGRAYLEENREMVDAIFERLAAIGGRMERRKSKREGHGRDDGPELPRSLDTALLHLRETVARAIAEDEKRSGEIVKLLLDAADRLEPKED